MKQVEMIERLLSYQKEDIYVLVDPIFGDEGSLYPKMSLENVKMMQKLAPKASLLVPNLTEAFYLLNQKSLKEATQEAMTLVKEIIMFNQIKKINMQV